MLSNPVLPSRGSLTSGDARTTNLGLFVQDAWSVGDRLTLQLGLRTEDEDVPSFSREPGIPETAVHFGFGDKLAPRLGFAWDATGDGRSKLFGSWGVFYDVMKLYMPLVYAPARPLAYRQRSRRAPHPDLEPLRSSSTRPRWSARGPEGRSPTAPTRT